MEWIVVAALLGAAIQCTAGYGFALVFVPVSMRVLPAIDAVLVATVVSASLCASGWWRLRSHTPRDLLGRFAAPAVLVAPIGSGLAAVLGDDGLRWMTGLCAVTFAVLAGRRRLVRLRPRHEVLVGAAAGVLSTSTGINGPALVLASRDADRPPESREAVVAAAICISSVPALVLLTARAGAPPAGPLAVVLCVALGVQYWFGPALRRSVSSPGATRGLLIATSLFGLASVTWG